MRSFEIEDIFVKYFLIQTCILVIFNDVLTISVRFIKSSRFCNETIKCSLLRHMITTIFGSDESPIKFLLSLYPMLVFPRTPFIENIITIITMTTYVWYWYGTTYFLERKMLLYIVDRHPTSEPTEINHL